MNFFKRDVVVGIIVKYVIIKFGAAADSQFFKRNATVERISVNFCVSLKFYFF